MFTHLECLRTLSFHDIRHIFFMSVTFFMLRLQCFFLPIKHKALIMKTKSLGQIFHQVSAIYGDQVESKHRQNYEKVAFLLEHLKLLKPTFLHFGGGGFIPYSYFRNRFFIQQY